MNPTLPMTLDEARIELTAMQDNPHMVTNAKYSPNASEYPDGLMPFVEIHLAYLRKNKLVNPSQYISNLAIMITER